MVTCSMLEQIITHEKPELIGWKPTFHPTGRAIELLANKTPDDDGRMLDAVILIGGVPYPALEEFGLKETRKSVKDGIFIKREKIEVSLQPRLALLPFGKASDILNGESTNSHYIETTIEKGAYDFLTGSGDEEIVTRGVTACLVTHKEFRHDSDVKDAVHKIQWVRHIVFRILSKLDPNHGLARDFGLSRAGEDKWKELASMLQRIHTGQLNWTDFGWQRHEDTVVKSLVDLWETGYRPTMPIIDPDDAYDPYP